jgi:hypothetical protein
MATTATSISWIWYASSFLLISFLFPLFFFFLSFFLYFLSFFIFFLSFFSFFLSFRISFFAFFLFFFRAFISRLGCRLSPQIWPQRAIASRDCERRALALHGRLSRREWLLSETAGVHCQGRSMAQALSFLQTHRRVCESL